MFEYWAKIDRVVDGDTVDVTFDLGFNLLKRERVRLQGIDAPETRTRDLEEKEKGLESKKFLEEWVQEHGPDFIIATQYNAKGKYGRVIGRIYNQHRLQCVNQLLVEKGLADIYKK